MCASRKRIFNCRPGHRHHRLDQTVEIIGTCRHQPQHNHTPPLPPSSSTPSFHSKVRAIILANNMYPCCICSDSAREIPRFRAAAASYAGRIRSGNNRRPAGLTRPPVSTIKATKKSCPDRRYTCTWPPSSWRTLARGQSRSQVGAHVHQPLRAGADDSHIQQPGAPILDHLDIRPPLVPRALPPRHLRYQEGLDVRYPVQCGR
jgi:hypothetical protein